MLKYEGVGVCHAIYCDSTVTGEYSEKINLTLLLLLLLFVFIYLFFLDNCFPL